MSSIVTQPPVSLSGDIEIGAVEIQDGVTGNRADVISSFDDNSSNNVNALRTSSRMMGFNGATWDRLRSGFVNTVSSLAGFLNVLPFMRYFVTQPSLNDGQGSPLQSDASGNLRQTLATLVAGEDLTNNSQAVVIKPLAVSTYTPDLDSSAAAEASSVTKASAGVLYGFAFSNANAAVRYLQFYNSTTVPADTAVPFLVVACAATSTTQGDFPKGIYFSTGISWANSSTQHTKTIGAADSLAQVEFK